MPMRAPASIDMLQMVRRASIDMARMAEPAYSTAYPVAPPIPISLMIERITSFAETAAGNAPSIEIRKVFGFFNQMVCVASTCLPRRPSGKKPKTLRISIEGALPAAVSAKDVILSIIKEIGIGGATGYAVEYAGSAIRAMSMEARLTICNMSIEAGARIGMIGPDDTTYRFLAGRANAPKGADWARALAYWVRLPTDPDAVFDRELRFDAGRLAPMVSWGTSP